MPIRYKHIIDNEQQLGPKYRYAIFKSDKLMFKTFKHNMPKYCKINELYAILNNIVYIKFI